MKQTSEQFLNAMLEDDNISNDNDINNFAEKMAEIEKRITDKVEETTNNIINKINNTQPINTTGVDDEEETNDNTDEEGEEE